MRRRKHDASGRRFFLEFTVATCLVGIGANLGDRAASLAAAAKQIAELPAVTEVRESRLFASPAAAGGTVQNEFLNAAIMCQTTLAPLQMLAALQRIETQLGRRRHDRWEARTIDLDLLLYDDVILSDPGLQLPHPRMAYRRFVLAPTAEIAPNVIHPLTGYTIRELLARLARQPRQIALTGASSRDVSILADRVLENSTAIPVEERQAYTLSEQMDVLGGSPTSQVAIELVNQRREDLRQFRQRSCHEPSDKTIELRRSWPGECLALAELLLADNALEDFMESWENDGHANELEHVTLTAVLLAPHEDMSEAALESSIQRLAMRPRQAPWLVLDAQDMDWAVTEVVAAIEAMQ